MMRKSRSASAPATPRDTGRSRDGRPVDQHDDMSADQASRDAREGGRGFDHLGRDASDAGDDGGRDQVGQDPRAAGGPIQPSKPFDQFDEFESSFGEFESAAYTPNVPNAPNVNAPSVDRFERSSEIRANRGVRANRESANRFQRGSEASDEGPGTARSTSAAEQQRSGRSLKGRALAYLSRREYSRAELSRKLMPFTDDADALEALLDALVREGWLSDARFAESVIHRRAARLGATRIVGELRRHAVGDTLIEEVNAQLRETELARARAVWQKKYGQLPATPTERARQARFLAARGFSMTIIGKILKGIDEDWTEN